MEIVRADQRSSRLEVCERPTSIGLDVASAEAQAWHDARSNAGYTGQRFETLECRSAKQRYGVASRSRERRRHDEAAWLEPERHTLEGHKRAHEQSGAHQEHERHRDLEHDERRSQAANGETSGARSRFAS